LLPFPLTERTVHLCVDMRRIFSVDGPWPTPWMERVLPVVADLAALYPSRTIFTRFIPTERPTEMPGMWQRYYTRWREATREFLDPHLLDLMPPLAALGPPAAVINKTRYSAFAEPWLLARCAGGRTYGPSSRSSRECTYRCEFDMESLVLTRGRDFPLQMLEDRLRCPRCGSRYVRVLFDPPLNQAIRRGEERDYRLDQSIPQDAASQYGDDMSNHRQIHGIDL
jgi:hypothetical protein